MTTIQIARDLQEQLVSGKQPAELRDHDGKLVGFFVPADANDSDLWDRARTAFTDEEIKLAQQETSGVTWAELREELERRWPSM